MTKYNAPGCWDRLVLDWYLPEGRDDITVADIVKVLSVPRQLEQLAGEGAEIVPYEHSSGTLTAVIGPTASNVQSFIMSIYVHEMSDRVVYPIPEGAVRVRSLEDVVDPPFGTEFLLGCMETVCPDWFYGNGNDLCIPKGQDVPLLEYAIPRWLTRLEDNKYGKLLGRWLRGDRSKPRPRRADVSVKFTRPEPEPAPATVLTRTEKILYAMRFYPAEARRTRSGKPYVRGLKKILGFHLTARERNTLWKQVTK